MAKENRSNECTQPALQSNIESEHKKQKRNKIKFEVTYFSRFQTLTNFQSLHPL